jgi:hypothetical protein
VIAWAWLWACGGDPAPAPPPTPAPEAEAEAVAPPPTAVLPTVSCVLPVREGKTTTPIAASPALQHTRAVLVDVVRRYDLDPENPWAVVHGMLALGADVPLSNGVPAVDHLFAAYAERRPEGGVAFPRKRGATRIEPHTDLVFKALTEGGVSFDRTVTVAGQPATLQELFRQSVVKTWVDDAAVSSDGFGDLGWTLQGIAACVPDDLAWTAVGGHPMTLDRLTSALVGDLSRQTQFLRDAIAAGQPVQKRKQGIFSYACGGTHHLMSAAYAVARGHGTPGDRAAVEAEVAPLLWRLDLELQTVDTLLPKHPEYADVLLEQRMKFLGHFLETTHKMVALGLFAPDDAQRAQMARGADELVATVAAMEQAGMFTDASLAQLRAKNEQTFLDVIGDAAHAVRGIDLATGAGSLRY